MYYRIYPNKNTTIFKKNTAGIDIRNGNINTGANPISEIYNGDGESIFLLGFDISSLTSKLQNYTYTCNLKVFDAGTLYEPALLPTDIDVLYFTEDFTEGDGFSYLDGKAVVGQANWNQRTALNNWGTTLTKGDLHAFTMQKANEDWSYNVSSFIADSILNTTNPNFGLRVAKEITATGSLKLTAGVGGDNISIVKVNGVTINNAIIPFNTDLATTALDLINNINNYTSVPNYTASIDPLDNTNIILTPDEGLGATANGFTIDVTGTITTTTIALSGGVDSAYKFESGVLYAKFMYTRHTKTIFQPYLEFIIEDEVVDGRHDCVAGQTSTLYLLNDLQTNFVGTLTGEIQDTEGNVTQTLTISNPTTGRYTASFTPALTDKGVYFDVWYIDGEMVAKNIIQVQSPNQILTKIIAPNLFFYPTTSYLHQTIRKGDVVNFNVISEQRGKGTIIKSNYEYRIVTTSGFEILPWSPVELYNSRMYFSVDTSYLYPELEYEVFVRLNESPVLKTSSLTYKFRLTEDSMTHLGNKSASPYNNRDSYLK